MQPFITFYTPTYQRPKALERCFESVRKQTIVRQIEQIVIPDHVGRGIAGMYADLPTHVGACNGEYVHFLADDDMLAAPDVVEQLQVFINGNSHHHYREDQRPAVVVVRVIKGNLELPLQFDGPPIQGRVDLGCFVVRGDVWRDFAGRGAYGQRYEGDYDFARAMWDAGVPFKYHRDLLFMVGDVRNGVAEADDPDEQPEEQTVAQEQVNILRELDAPQRVIDIAEQVASQPLPTPPPEKRHVRRPLWKALRSS